MMKLLANSLLVAQALAFPAVLEHLNEQHAREFLSRDASPIPLMKRADNVSQAISQAQTNCGPLPCLVFNAAEQFVSTSGQHAFQAPGQGDLRGPCPGLNAAANHGYIPRNGIAHIVDTIAGLGAAYAMAPDLAGFLAAYAIAIDGDPLSLRWSIGGPIPGMPPLSFIGKGQGISEAHNKYEGDTSLTRGDKFINNGNAASMKLDLFTKAYEVRGDEDRITLDKFRQRNTQRIFESVTQNPYYFAPLFSTTIVAPAAYNFIVNFMSNHTAEEPSGYLNGEIFKSFFSVTGDYPNFQHTPGHERIPDNWYRRTSLNSYIAPNVFQDVIVGWQAYPNNFRFGGNIAGVDTYRGIDIATLTGGQYSFEGLFEGNNLACLLFQTQQQFIPDILLGGVGTGLITNLLNERIGPLIQQFGCPDLEQFNPSVYDQYPGYKRA